MSGQGHDSILETQRMEHEGKITILESKCQMYREAIEGMLRISDLWLPTTLPIDQHGEGEALHMARHKMIVALEVKT